jgi:uncharacterized small protein (DUF1192 family)
MIEDDEKTFGAPPKRPMTHEIGQLLDTLSVAELDERILLLRAEITRLEETKRFKQDSQAAAAALFKL